MKRCLPSALSLLLLSAAVGCANGQKMAVQEVSPAAADSPNKLVVQVDQPGIKISPILYGIFFEDINCSADGGIYAELVRNRSFADKDTPEHWYAVGKAQLAIDKANTPSAKNPNSLKLTVPEAGAGVANDGFWGMALVKDAKYDLSLMARGDGGPLVVSLESKDGKTVYAQKRFEGLAADWKPLTATLTSEGTDPAARLVIRAAEAGAYWLDMVSLFPQKTFNEHGLRPDLVQKLVDMKPAFVRFPGGCWVEGDTMAFAQRWKTTIGPVSERRTQYNIWQYYATNGIGYHEYLQMCEDLNAEPLFVINCGMSHREVVPMDKMDEFVQDALDAIEYANGPVESKWGSLRAKAGHPKPFNLRLMEIGNENGGPAYHERWNLFYDAIRAKYPEIKLISNVAGDFGQRKPDIVDEHYYSSPEFFIQQASRYDTYDRKGPKIYVGEYACTQGCGQGNLRAAVGEAAFMVGMEKNSDVVTMSSYAPLFANIHYKKWNPDLIDFDSSRVYGIPSYYVQQMFAQNRGDVVLPAAVTVPEEPAPPRGGAVGVGTWNTQAEFKDLKVAQGDKVLYQADFAKGDKDWKALSGKWTVADNVYRQTSDDNDVKAIVGDPKWQDYTLTLKARKTGGAEGFLILFNVKDENNWVWWNVGGWGNTATVLERMDGGGKSELGKRVNFGVENNKWYDVKIAVQGDKIQCYLDDKLITTATYKHISTRSLYTTASRDTATGDVIVKVVNVTKAPLTATVDLRGAQVGPTGTATVLTAEDPMAENAIDNPTKVAPVTTKLEKVTSTFGYTFPANSVTVLRLNAK